MSLENWIQTRKTILLNEKKEQLFHILPSATDFHAVRAELYHVLSRLENHQRGNEITATPSLDIPMIA